MYGADESDDSGDDGHSGAEADSDDSHTSRLEIWSENMISEGTSRANLPYLVAHTSWCGAYCRFVGVLARLVPSETQFRAQHALGAQAQVQAAYGRENGAWWRGGAP